MDAFEFLDFTEDEAKSAVEQIEKFGNRDGRICLCGHSIKFHGFIENRGVFKCNAQKQTCPCRHPKPVLITNNARVFIRKTHGAGQFHALTQGIVAAISSGSQVEWIVEMRCEMCKREAQLSPVPMNANGEVSRNEEATGYDALLCRDCRSGNRVEQQGLRVVE